ncbi:CDI toxin immunity protein [Bacillus atrophaeus]
MDLFDECLEGLGDDKEILSEELTEKYYELLTNRFPFTSWGRIKWEEVRCHQSIDYEEEIDEWLDVHPFKDRNIIILWGYGEQPALRTSLDNALNVIDDVTAVGADTFMFSESEYVIEFFHDDDVTIGKSPHSETICK